MQTLARRVREVGFLAVLLTAAFQNLSAQQLTAQIKGTVTDASGSAVLDASVKATNIQTGVSSVVPTAKDGSFQFLQLPVGVYDVSVTAAKFTTFTENEITLVLNQIYNLPAKLQVGSISQTVEVEANAAQVETTNTQMDTVFDSKKIVDLPLIGRNWTQLEQLVPGVVASSDRLGSGNYATNGSETQQNSFLINGADSMDLPLNTPLIIPSPDAIAEFDLIESTINPEYGRNSGGILNAVFKSGTNTFHGDAFEFYRDTFLNGRNLFQQSKQIFHQNQFGGTLGGPVWKDHTFFFLSYQGRRYREPEPGQSDTTSVFTADQRNGYFPDIAAASSSVSAFSLIGENGRQYLAGTPYSTIFPTGHIPSADINPIAAKLLNTYVPLPNSPGGLYSFNPIQSGSADQGLARIDHTFGSKDTLWATLFFENDPSQETLPFSGASLPGFGDMDKDIYKTFSADWTHTFTPNTLNEARLSYSRLNSLSTAPQTPVPPSSLGFNINPQDPAGAGIPVISLNGYFSLGFSYNGPQPRIDDTYEAADNIFEVIGHHTMKFGFDAKRYNVDNPFDYVNNGYYGFGGPSPFTTNDAGADFLLGIPNFYEQTSGGWQVARTYEYYAYAQDSWKLSDDLTINYGTGYQIDTPLNNLHFGGEDANCFVPGQQSAIFPSAPTSVLFPGDRGCTQSGYHSHYDHFGPRFGFAYSPDSRDSKKFVIRGGFGIYFNRTEEELQLANLQATPFSLTSFGAGSVAGLYSSFANPYQDLVTGRTVTNPFPYAAPTKGATNVNFLQDGALTVSTASPNLTSPYAMNFNVNIQRELPGAAILQLGYVGSLGRHLELSYEGNPITPAGASACLVDPSCVANRSIQQLVYPSHTAYAPGNVLQSVGVQSTDGISSYNSLQVSLNKRPTHGLSYLASYTWSHAIDDTSGFEDSGYGARGINPYDFASNRGGSSYDARQRLVFSYDYELPHVSRFWKKFLVRGVLDGWHVAGITTLQTGFPINPADGYLTSLTCSGLQKYGCWDAPNVDLSVSSLNPRNSVLTNTVSPTASGSPLPYYYFNPNGFSLPAIGMQGDAGRNSLHGPGLNNTDLVLSKRIYLGSEGTHIELRLEGYNVFNHTQFKLQGTTTNGGNGVSGDINDPNFGRVLTALSGRVIQLGAKFYF